MAKTLLAVDDSVTMRKVLEITFSGEDFRVITAESSQAALGKLGDNPGVFVVDTVLGGDDGYALAKELRKRAPGAAIVMLASRYAPYDQARGRDAGADDFADKPFDTQQLIDKVRKVVAAKEAAGPVAAAPAPAPTPAPAPLAGPATAPPPPAAAAAAARAAAPSSPSPIGGSISRSTQQSLGGAVPRTGLGSGDSVPAAAAAPAPRPLPSPLSRPAPALSPAQGVAAQVNGAMAGKLGEMGLTPAQAEAVLALSREVVERVVWEVVPQLAETLIKEEITRLTR